MYFLGIEASCDETAAAVIRAEGDQAQLLAEEISSQTKIHAEYGGVVPELAAREHLQNLGWIVDKCMQRAALGYADLSAIGVTRGPGLKGCLLMGCSFAKALAVAHGTPVLGINHIEAHIQVALLDNPGRHYPFLALIVSGGHTEIVLAQALSQYKILARTHDDAAGEAFDKSANLLGFPYPGGAKLAQLADSVVRSRFKLPRVMREAEGFSFSGLKTAISQLVALHANQIAHEKQVSAEIAYAVQEAIVNSLCHKLKQAIQSTGVKKVAVVGGVAANSYLREQVAKISGIEILFPINLHCMDNGAMVAYVTMQKYLAGCRDALNISTLSRWPIEDLRAN